MNPSDIKPTVRRSIAIALGVLAASSATTVHAFDSLFDISIGPRVDDLRWSISGPNGMPDIASELNWRSVDSYQLGFDFEIVSDGGLALQASASFGSIHDGRVTDADYLGNNRTGLFHLTEAETNDDDLVDLSISIGRAFPVTDTERTTVTPFIGVSHREQDFSITDGINLFDPFGGTAGQSLDGLDSRYQTEWQSAFVGAQIDHRGSRWHTFGRVEYHDVNYEAEADWNLRDDLAHPVSFSHDADGSGPIYTLGTRYRFSGNWAVNARVNWSNLSADNGTARAHRADGTVVDSPLNSVRWKHTAVMLGVSYINAP